MIAGVYLVLDPHQTAGRSPLSVAEGALRGGVRAVQWRQKIGSLGALWDELLAVRALCRRYSVPFLVNDRVDIALAVEADGAHLGQDDLPPSVARKLLPQGLLGVSVGCPEEVEPAVRGGADHLGVGPVFATSSKPDAGSPIGLDGIRAVRDITDLPIVAIGGITAQNAGTVREAGADALAVISAICGAEDVEEAARALVTGMESIVLP